MNNKIIEYSIAIRTLGYGGDKYKRLLDSIKKLNNKPKEVLIVIADGYKKPNERLGYEKFIYSQKGMLEQRIIGIEEAKSKYVLLLDDDISFEENLINKLYETIKNKGADIVFPIYRELLPESGIKSIVSCATSSAVPRKEDDFYIKFIRSGGYSYPTEINKLELESQSAPGMCLFGKTEVLKNLNLREEVWVTIPEYELRDDAVLIYKAYINGYKIFGRADVIINHLDNASDDKSRRNKSLYALGYSQIKFWNKYIYNLRKNRILSLVSITYWIFINLLFLVLTSIKKGSLDDVKFFIRGIIEGIK